MIQQLFLNQEKLLQQQYCQKSKATKIRKWTLKKKEKGDLWRRWMDRTETYTKERCLLHRRPTRDKSKCFILLQVATPGGTASRLLKSSEACWKKDLCESSLIFQSHTQTFFWSSPWNVWWLDSSILDLKVSRLTSVTWAFWTDLAWNRSCVTGRAASNQLSILVVNLPTISGLWLFQMSSMMMNPQFSQIAKPIINIFCNFHIVQWSWLTNIIANYSSYFPHITSFLVHLTKYYHIYPNNVHTVDGRNPKQPPGMVLKPYK